MQTNPPQIGSILFLQMQPSSSFWSIVLPGMIFVVFGNDIVISVAGLLLIKMVDEDQHGLVAGILFTANQVGIGLGLAIHSAIVKAAIQSYGGHPSSGHHGHHLSAQEEVLHVKGFHAAFWASLV